MHFLSGQRARMLAFALALSPLPFLAPPANAQRPSEQPDAARILHAMQKLDVLGSVLYIAAHPDDENTRLIAWLANGKKVRTGYLSLTRGEGGQNLIGPELGDALGIIRTQELLEARRIDGGEQFFTRATDFGFSKNAQECFAKWGHDEVLGDVVRVIRQFRPDILITRFPPTREAGHGAHEASALLAEEAFKLAGDPKAFPEQLQQGLQVWQPQRLFFNGSTWWKKDLAEFAATDPDWYTVDVGGYDPLLGLSYTEIAGRSRSMHKSQGFGSAETRGEMLEYLKLIGGDKPASKDIFDGIDMTWGRLAGTTTTAQRVQDLIATFDAAAPERSNERLMALIQGLSADTARPWARKKLLDASDLLYTVNGMVTEATAPADKFANGDSVRATVRSILRRPGRVGPERAELWDAGQGWARTTLQMNTPLETVLRASAPRAVDEPYWLQGPHTNLYISKRWQDIGKPVVPATTVQVDYQVNNTTALQRQVPLLYKWVDRVDGERLRPVYVTPVASVEPKNTVLVARGGPQRIEVIVRALTDDLVGQLNVRPPTGWATSKEAKRVDIAKRDGQQTITVELTPLGNAQAGAVQFEFVGPKGRADRTLHEIDHPHILPQVYYTPAEVKLVPLDVKVNAKLVGYIKGAGDEVPQAIEQLGVSVEMIDLATVKAADLARYDAIVTGIRAYNTDKELKALNPVLMHYVENGGTLMVQYNTQSSDMVLPDSLIGPYPFKITRDRVTVEEAPATFLHADSPLLNTPNAITAADLDGWVQERGLYFLGKLDPHYTPLIAWNDPGEQPLNGALVSCDLGKGRYIYTGISFFRELPAGVPGAYRLFANLIARRITEEVKR